ncbi:hypothetical protein PHMEG_00025948 [Phytophthora megakarya]|uniref:Retrotransposon gag domain-containing protein n=1 Tax=Phytophthora megakarya TaxID=4795 RepID=A0A225VAW1_9STRA|nr:hypothetical protein PHMEG_00025948 [Phytophthora megakarya]
MESVESHHGSHGEYDPDNLSIDTPRQAVIASAGAASAPSTTTPRIRVSAISELKEYSGKDHGEDRARGWLGEVKSAFVHDQTPDSEKCLILSDLLTGPSRNWYRQLSRSTRINWKSLFEAFQRQYCGRGVSVTWQYYHAKKRRSTFATEWPEDNNNNDWLVSICEANEASGREAKEHVKHFLETCGGRDLERQLTPMQLRDIHTLEDIVSDTQKVEKRVSSRSSSQNGKRHSSSSGSYGRHDSRSRSQERSLSEPRHTSRVALAEASVMDLITELQTVLHRKDPTSTRTTTRMTIRLTSTKVMKLTKMGATAIAFQETRSKVRILTLTKTRDWLQPLTTMNVEMLLTGHLHEVTSVHKTMDNSQVDLVKVDSDLQLNLDRGSTITAADAGSRDQVMNHSTHFSFRRCRLCKQEHDFGKCEAFDELAKILRTNPQSADLVIDAECLYAFTGKCEWPEDNNNNDENEKNVEFDGECGVCLDGGTLHEIKEDTTISKVVNDDWLVSICEANEAATVHAKTVELLPGERMGCGRRRDSTDE